MKVFLDVGNTRLKVGILLNETVSALASITHQHLWPETLEKIDWPTEVSSIDVASVVGSNSEQQLAEALFKKFGVTAVFHRSKKQLGRVVNAYGDFERLGVDRWLVVLAAYQRFERALCVVDCGTSLTIDLVSDEGHHLGGYILPGLQLARSALLKGTQKIWVPAEQQAASLSWGQSSAEAVDHGILLLLVASIEKAVEIFRQQQKIEPLVVLTGGDADIIKPLLAMESCLADALVLEGIYWSTKLS